MSRDAVCYGCNSVQPSNIQTKAIDQEQCFPVVLFIMSFNVLRAILKSVDEVSSLAE